MTRSRTPFLSRAPTPCTRLSRGARPQPGNLSGAPCCRRFCPPAAFRLVLRQQTDIFLQLLCCAQRGGGRARGRRPDHGDVVTLRGPHDPHNLICLVTFQYRVHVRGLSPRRGGTCNFARLPPAVTHRRNHPPGSTARHPSPQARQPSPPASRPCRRGRTRTASASGGTPATPGAGGTAAASYG